MNIKQFSIFNFFILMMVCLAVNAAVRYPIDTLKGSYQNTPFRVDETLQQIQAGKDCQDEFKKKGGTLIVFDPNADDINKFVVKPGDDVRIGCTAGWCRSQTLHLIFEMFDGIMNRKPHGTRYFFDTAWGKPQWNKNIQSEAGLDEFESCFGLKKADRVGHKEFSHMRNSIDVSPETIREVQEFYDQHYFGPQSFDSNSKRIVYITFAANAHVILYRLNQTNQDLSKHILICIDVDDYMTNPLAEWNTYPRSVKAYTKCAQHFMSFFDFSQLELKKPPKNQADPFEKVKSITLYNMH